MVGGRTGRGDRIRGPVNSEFEGDAARARIGHGARNGKRRHAWIAVTVEALIALLFRELSAYATTGNHGGPVTQLSFESQTALGYRLAGRNSSKLGKAFDQQKIFFAEVNCRIKLKGFCSEREFVRWGPGIPKWCDSALARGQASPRFRYGITQRTDQPQPCNGDAVQTSPGGTA